MPTTVFTNNTVAIDDVEPDTSDVVVAKTSPALRSASIPHVPGYARNFDWARATLALPEEAAGTGTGPTRVIY